MSAGRPEGSRAASRAASRELPPGPRTPVRTLIALIRDPLDYYTTLCRRYGPVVSYLRGRQTMFLFNDPELIKEVLVVHHRAFRKDRGLQLAKKVLGEGLLASEGDYHQRQRRLVAPAFHRERLAAYGDEIVAAAAKTGRRWRDGESLDALVAMDRLTLAIVGATLFGTDVEREADELGETLAAARDQFTVLGVALSILREKLPFGGESALGRARVRLDRALFRRIEERRQSGVDRGDLLSLLLLAKDADGDGSGMTDQEVRDEAMTIFIAGQETITNALAWTWYLLGQNPEVEARLHAEIDAVLGGRPATAADVPRLPYTEHVIAESMRLFPPSWALGRVVAEDVRIGGWEVRAGDAVVMSQWVMHRDARYFPDPLRFDPDRWEPAAVATRPKLSYFPFGAGPRSCIGASFAWMEAILVLATLAQDWRLRLVPHARVTPVPRLTLRPFPGVPVRLERRRRGESSVATAESGSSARSP